MPSCLAFDFQIDRGGPEDHLKFPFSLWSCQKADKEQSIDVVVPLKELMDWPKKDARFAINSYCTLREKSCLQKEIAHSSLSCLGF